MSHFVRILLFLFGHKPIPERLTLDVALDVERSEWNRSAHSLGLAFDAECSNVAGKLLLKSSVKCGKIRLKLLKFSADDASVDRLNPI